MSTQTECGIEAIHWSDVGAVTAPDAEILCWAKAKGYVVVTQDLDFPEYLALTKAALPSVILIRNADVLAVNTASLLRATARQCGAALDRGAIVVLDARGRRVRTLPIQG